MKCERCDNEATVHEVMIRNGKRHERHLCEACAKGEGVAGQPHIPITQLLNQFITSQVQPTKPGQPVSGQVVAGATAIGTCPTCGVTIAQFKQTGLLGCPDCYAAFEAQLAPLLQRAHEGGTHHTGKRPARFQHQTPSVEAVAPPSRPKAKPAPAVASAEETERQKLAANIVDLKKRLLAAVDAEKYEDAAKLRDELAKVQALAAEAGMIAKPPSKAAAKPRSPKRRGDEERA